jgi:hypothetical protein
MKNPTRLRWIRFPALFGLLILAIGFQAQMGWTQAVGEFTDHTGIGDVQIDMNVTFDDGMNEYIVEGDGNIWGAEDTCHFVYKEITGSFSITGTVWSFGGGSGKSGFMARETLEPNSRNYFVITQDNGQARSQYRLEPGGPTVNFTAHSNTDGKVELVRLGNTFYGYFYDFNDNKELMHKTRLDVGDTIYVGLATGSGTAGEYAEGFFTDVNIRLFSFSADRVLPGLTFQPNKKVEEIKVSVNVREGTSPNMTIIETPPVGWTVSNIQTQNGTASLDDSGNIVWSISQASGTPIMTYDIVPSQDADSGVWKGTASDGSDTFEIFGDLGMSNEFLVRIYFITSGNPDAPSNAVYRDLLSKGLTMLDESGSEIFIPGLGYSVSVIDENNDDPQDALDYDVVIVHENCASGNPGRYGDLPVSYLNMEQALFGGATNKPGYIWFGGGSAATGYDEAYVLDDHPITDLWGRDALIAFTKNQNPEFSHIPWGNLASGVTPLLELGTVGGILLAVADTGTTGLTGTPPEGFQPTPARRAILGYHETVHVYSRTNDDGIEDIALTKDGAILLQRLVQWLANKDVTADGTEQSVGIQEWSLF